MTTTNAFTDVHGVTHENAVFEVNGVNVYSNASKQVFKDSDGKLREEESDNSTVDFSAQFWTNQQAKDNGLLPINFTVIDSNSGFEQSTFPIEDLVKPEDMSATDLIEAAELKILEMIG